VKITAQ